MWTFPQRRVHYLQYQYFFTFYLFGGGGCVRTPLPTGLITYVQYLYLNALLLTAFEHLRTSLVYLLTYCTSITFCVIQQNLQTGNESVPIQLAQCWPLPMQKYKYIFK